MEARQISVQLRRDPREIAERHSQANPLTLSCTLARGEGVEQNLSLYAELHTSRTPASVPLAAVGPVSMTTGSFGPWELDFTSAQMNQTVLPGEDVEFWLVVYATSATPEVFTLATIRLTLQYDNISQVIPPPPEPSIAGNVFGPASATDNALVRFDGTTGKLLQNSAATLTDAGLLTVPDASVTGTLTAPRIHGNLAGSIYSHVRNESGGPLTKGTPVYIVGYSVGQSRPLVAAAASGNSASMPAIGILDEDLANNASGHCVVFGTIENLDTSTYQVNAPLYVASAGGLTATEPSARIQPIAQVERVNANNGSILVLTALYSSLAQQSASAVSITGGTITGLTNLTSTIATFSTSLSVTSSTASTSTTTGALVVTGGGGIGGALNVGADSFFNGVRVGQGGFSTTSNCVLGTGAGGNRTGGSNSVFIGQNSGASGSGSDNTFVGASTMTSSGTSLANTLFGRSVMQGATSAARVCAFGFQAGRFFGVGGSSVVTTLSDCILIGNNARPSADSEQGSIVIANGGINGAISDGSNTTVIGTTSTASTRVAGTATSVFIVSGNEIRILNSSTPASATATGVRGGIEWDADYLYVATATNSWKRVKIRTWPNDELPIAEGGTGASTAAGARANLGLEGSGSIINESGTTWTLAVADAAKYHRFTSSSAITITIPTNATAAIPIGSEYFIRRAGTGAISFSNAGVTVNNSDIANLDVGKVCCLKKIATDEWDYI